MSESFAEHVRQKHAHMEHMAKLAAERWVLAERERCARIAEEDDGPDNPDIVYECGCHKRIAARIRSGE